MTITDADIRICAAALQLIGAEEIGSFEDESREARTCASIYPTLRQNLLQKNTWRFSVRQEQLNRLVATPLFGYAYAYSLPSDFLRLVGKNNPSAKHQIFENKVYTDLSTLYANLQYDVDAQYYPAYFTHLFQLELAALLAGALLEDENKTDKFMGFAQRQLLIARNIDSQNNSSSTIPTSAFNLTNVRF
jgi:hypothetical protein